MSASAPEQGRSAALLLSTPSFEWFYEERLNLDRRAFLDEYRNDWSWEYMAALRLAGIRPHLYIATEKDAERHVLGDGTVVQFLKLSPADLVWRTVPALRRSRYGRYAWQVANAVALLPALRRALQQDGVQSLFVQEYWMGRWDVLARRLDVPVIGVDQGYPEKRDIKRFKRGAFEKAAAVIAQTKPEAAKVATHGGRAVVMSNAVDTRAYFPGPSGDRIDRNVVTVARLADGHKRTSDLIRAVAGLGEGWTLDLYGDGPDRAELESLAASLGAKDRIDFKGFVMDRDVTRHALRTCSVFALPSAFEGLPMALLEAMGSGAAVVGTDIPSITEVVQHDENGLIVPVGAIPALAGAIQVADAHRGRLGAAARQTVLDRFSLDTMAARLGALVEPS